MNFPKIKNPKTGRSTNDLTGQRFGRLLVLERSGRQGFQTTWRCRCDCGKVKDAALYGSITSGQTQSCGCLRTEKLHEPATHGKTGTRVHAAWGQMKQRCYNPKTVRYEEYGGRGITVCERWKDSFENFYADMGDPPEGYSLDRKETNGNYEPDNCRWADVFTQQRNRRYVGTIPWKGEQRTMTDIAILENVRFCSLRNKVKINGMTVEDAVADCRARGLTYVERAKAQRPQLAQFAELTEPRS